MAGTVTSQHPGRVTPVRRELLLVEVEGGAGTARDTAVEVVRGDTTDTAVLERQAATILGPAGATVEDTPAVATPVIVTGPQPRLVATPPAPGRATVVPRDTATIPTPATPRPGQLVARLCLDLVVVVVVVVDQSDQPPGIPEQIPTAETNNNNQS